MKAMQEIARVEYLVVKAFLASVSSGLGANPVGDTRAKYDAEEEEVGREGDELAGAVVVVGELEVKG